MMQDTVLTMCKSSVMDFTRYILKYCPSDTKITSTEDVVNTFDIKRLTPEDSDYEEAPF